MDLLIKGGTVVWPWGQRKVDILVDRGKIVALGNAENLPDADRTLNAENMFVMPGGIDTHTHFDTPFQGAKGDDTFYTGSIAAAFGGTTTLIDFAVTPKGESPIKSIESRVNSAIDSGIVIDFGFHCIISEASPRLLGEIKDVIEYGVPSFKMFTIYRKEGFMVDDGVLMAVLGEVSKSNGIVGIHAENGEIAEYKVEQLLKEGKTGWSYHAISKPNFVEAEPIQRVWTLAQEVGAALFIFHMSTHEGVSVCDKARLDKKPLYAETCPHYLQLTDKVYDKEDGYLYLISPPLRKKEDCDEIWKGISRKSINTLGTDHAPFMIREKQMLLDKVDGKIVPRFDKVPNGAPGVEVKVPTLMQAYSEGKLTIEEVVSINSYQPARIMGLYPKKGLIEVGADADIVIMDPNKEKHISGAEDLHIKCDWTPYKGMTFKGWPKITMVRGNILIEDDKFVGKKGNGEFVKRKIDPEVLKNSKWL